MIDIAKIILLMTLVRGGTEIHFSEDRYTCGFGK